MKKQNLIKLITAISQLETLLLDPHSKPTAGGIQRVLGRLQAVKDSEPDLIDRTINGRTYVCEETPLKYLNRFKLGFAFMTLDWLFTQPLPEDTWEVLKEVNATVHEIYDSEILTTRDEDQECKNQDEFLKELR